eukprot:3529955-Prymnesium_polylepis.1
MSDPILHEGYLIKRPVGEGGPKSGSNRKRWISVFADRIEWAEASGKAPLGTLELVADTTVELLSPPRPELSISTGARTRTLMLADRRPSIASDSSKCAPSHSIYLVTCRQVRSPARLRDHVLCTNMLRLGELCAAPTCATSSDARDALPRGRRSDLDEWAKVVHDAIAAKKSPPASRQPAARRGRR